MADKAVVNLVRRYLRQVELAGIPVVAGILFGSHARGDARKDSDIDLLIVTANSSAKKLLHDTDLVWQLRTQVDYRIEPVLVGSDRWKNDKGSPLLAMIRSEGRNIAA